MRYFALAALVAACSSSPANVAGNFTVAVTNRDNACGFANWTVGQQTSGISVVITQSSANATANITGGSGLILDAVIGTHAFTGTISGDNIDLKATGTQTMTQGNCTYTIDGEILGSISGDVLTGRIDYTGAGNGGSNCTSINGCLTYQDFNGTRPPS